MMKLLLVALVIAAGCGVENPSDGAQTSGGDGKEDQSTPHANVQTLNCTTGNFRQFSAKLDSSGFEPGSGYFDVRNARVMDGYATAELICTGHRLEEIDCLGFWFGTAEYIAEVTTANGPTGLTASHVTLRGDLVAPNGPWPCTVQ